jgi:hypothetical protein
MPPKRPVTPEIPRKRASPSSKRQTTRDTIPAGADRFRAASCSRFTTSAAAWWVSGAH